MRTKYTDDPNLFGIIDLLVRDFLPLSIRVASNTAGLDDNCDGSTLDVMINNNLPAVCPLDAL